jgi:hypothetical protein
MSAVHAAKHLLPAAARLWDHATPAANSPALDADQADAVAAAAEDQGIEEETALTWRAQDALVERLPQVGGALGGGAWDPLRCSLLVTCHKPHHPCAALPNSRTYPVFLWSLCC